MTHSFSFYDDEALLHRLTTGLKKRPQEVIFLVGAPLSATLTIDSPGVPDVMGIIDLIRKEFEGETSEKNALDRELSSAGKTIYQAAFSFLQGRRGQQTANEIVVKAVLSALSSHGQQINNYVEDPLARESAYRNLEFDTNAWNLNPGTQNLGRLVAKYPDRFGGTLLTTNFDPLLEIAIRKAGGGCYKTVLHSDGNLGQTESLGCHVVHLHGSWHGTDSLHTLRQLRQPRPHLKDSLRSLLRNKLVVVCAYGGWDDIFTEALIEVVRDITAFPEVIWTFYQKKPEVDESLGRQLLPGIDRGRVSLYSGIDCNALFPSLFNQWLNLEPAKENKDVVQSNPVHATHKLSLEIKNRTKQQTIIEGDEEDRPPLVELCIGRENELHSLITSNAKVAFITGLGGQGKSTIAAQYYSNQLRLNNFSFYVWRDCKEESERFENQLCSLIEKLSEGKVSGGDLAKQNANSITDILLSFIKDRNVLFVFDNVDHYVDLEAAKMTGALDIFIRAFLASPTESQVLFTCRPDVRYDSEALNIHLEGISLDAAIKLFAKRSATSSVQEIQEAHQLTEGHAFWLDLLAIQVGKQHLSLKLSTLVAQIGSGTELAGKTLNSIWATLQEKEQTVLRSMAETVKPETEAEIAEYLRDEMNYNRVARSLKNLRTLNLVVVKARDNAPNLHELHPLLRGFIKENFPQKERLSFIDKIIKAYEKFIGKNKKLLLYRPSLVILQYWTQNAELDIAAGRFDKAFFLLYEVSNPFLGSAYPREFTRVVRSLLDTVDWVADHVKFPEFEIVFRTCILILCDLGEFAEVDSLLGKYELTVPSKDSRYINYCDLRCYSNWVRNEFTTAVRWGKIGQNLKNSTGVDTTYDVSHHLALAERDVGRPELALSLFLSGNTLSSVIDPSKIEEPRGGHYYGNIGRCLHLMGQIEPTLVCYQKSGLLLEKATSEHFVNQGFIRAWVGELLVARQQIKLAYIFYRAAYLKWQKTSPLRAVQVNLASFEIKRRFDNSFQIDDASVEALCIRWFLGEDIDSECS